MDARYRNEWRFVETMAALARSQMMRMLRRLPGKPGCFRCGSACLQRSGRRNWFERALSPVLLPYRCRICDLRLFKFSWLNSNAVGVPATKAPVPAWEWKAESNRTRKTDLVPEESRIL